MARGGARAGAGRPRKPRIPSHIQLVTVSGETLPPSDQPRPGAYLDRDGRLVLPSDWLDPLTYLLGIINDPQADPARRDRAAMAAAPFVHDRRAGIYLGAKRIEQQQAERAGENSEWATILRTAD